MTGNFVQSFASIVDVVWSSVGKTEFCVAGFLVAAGKAVETGISVLSFGNVEGGVMMCPAELQATVRVRRIRKGKYQ
jgi:hypothetical protein